MKRFLYYFILLSLLLAPAPAMARDVLTIATEGGYPPFNYFDETGQVAGFDVDLSYAICKQLNIRCKIVTVEWGKIIDGLVEGKYDAIVASMAKTPERDMKIDFTDSYYRSRSSFVAKAGVHMNVIPGGMIGKRIAAQDDTVQAQYLRENFGKHSTILTPPTHEEALRLLVDGKVDAVLSDNLVLFDFLQTPEGKNFDYLGDPLPPTTDASISYIAVQEGNDALRTSINKALRELKMNGTYDRITKKYFPFSIY